MHRSWASANSRMVLRQRSRLRAGASRGMLSSDKLPGAIFAGEWNGQEAIGR